MKRGPKKDVALIKAATRKHKAVTGEVLDTPFVIMSNIWQGRAILVQFLAGPPLGPEPVKSNRAIASYFACTCGCEAIQACIVKDVRPGFLDLELLPAANRHAPPARLQ